MADFYGLKQDVKPNDALFTPVFGLTFCAPSNAQRNADKTVTAKGLSDKYNIKPEDIFVASRLLTGLMLVGNSNNDTWREHALDAPMAHPITEAIAAASTGNKDYAAAHPLLYEITVETIDEAVNTACGNDLRARAQFRRSIESGSDLKALNHLVRAIIGELVSVCSVSDKGDALGHSRSRITGMPLDVEHALKDLPMAVVEGYEAWASAHTFVSSAFAGPTAFLIPSRGELNTIGKGAVHVPAFRLYPVALHLAHHSGSSFFSVAESVGLDPICSLSSAAAVCGCSFGVVWPTVNIGGLNYKATDVSANSSAEFISGHYGKIAVTREVITQADARSHYCVTHDWKSKTARVLPSDLSAETEIITMLGNMCCRHTDVMLYNEVDKSVRHAHTIETKLLPPGKWSVGLPPAFAWTSVSRTGILASARFQAEQIYLGNSFEGTMLETRKYYKTLAKPVVSDK
jgi:hypothetical protein